MNDDNDAGDLQSLKELRANRVAVVAFRDKLIKLYNDPIFKEIIVNEYMVIEVARFMDMAGSPMLKAEQRAEALSAAYAPGALKRWIDARLVLGDQAENQIKEIDEEIDELMQGASEFPTEPVHSFDMSDVEYDDADIIVEDDTEGGV